jgi:hypothetical protein
MPSTSKSAEADRRTSPTDTPPGSTPPGSTTADAAGSSPESREWLVTVLLAVGIAFGFWWLLAVGGGLIGGDVYAYYLPQKAYLADALRNGEIPLWNNRGGYGYPLLAESQTALLYPTTIPLFWWFDLNTAYNAQQLLHYAFAFVAVVGYARRIGLSPNAARFAAIVFVYGWFPPRICLEWAIVTGAWLPVVLWMAEAHLQTRQWRFASAAAVGLCLQILAGHFHLAFITQLTLLAYVPIRLFVFPSGLPAESMRRRGRLVASLMTAFVLSLGLSAVQLLPTWELTQLSQRGGSSPNTNPAYGHIPVWYWSQMIAPWMWYPVEAQIEFEGDLNSLLPPGSPGTNMVEAHLFCGLTPMFCAVLGILYGGNLGSRRWLWLLLGMAALAYTPGWLLPVLGKLPGFGFFQGAGRFGIVTTLAVGLLAGAGVDSLCRRVGRVVPWILVPLCCGVTLWELATVSGQVTYSIVRADPATDQLQRSPLLDEFRKLDAPPRVFSSARNIPQMIGAASFPPYLGLAPRVYFDDTAFPTGGDGRDPRVWEMPGLSHVLANDPIRSPKLRLVWQGLDPFVNLTQGRVHDPLFLYEVAAFRGRCVVVPADGGGPLAGATARIQSLGGNRVVIQTKSNADGELVLYDLAYPGWKVTVDGVSQPGFESARYFRGVKLPAGEHTVVWTYQPRSVWIGAIVTLASALLLAAAGHIRYWHPGWTTWWDDSDLPRR